MKCTPTCYAERSTKYGILFIFNVICEYVNLEHVRIHVIYKATQAEYAARTPMAAPQEYLNTYSTRRRVLLSEVGTYGEGGARRDDCRERLYRASAVRCIATAMSRP